MINIYTIEVIGLGAGEIEQLPLGIYRKLTKTERIVYARTMEHPVITSLKEEGMKFRYFDHIYEQYDDFSSVYKRIVKELLEAAKKQPIIYAVPGHPMMAEKTVQLLLEQQNVPIEIAGGQSFLDDMFTALKIDPIEGLQLIDGTNFTRENICYRQHIIIGQIYDQFVASEVKLTLLEDLPEDYVVTLVYDAGSSHAKVEKTPLYKLDRRSFMNNRLSVYVPPVSLPLLNHTFTRLREIIATLRGENGCPWDRKQTHESLRPYLVEETYELIDAINEQDDEAIVEELGDVLLQVMLHSQIGEDSGYFTVNDVIKGITEKMIHRHPQVFSNRKEIKTWEQLKAEEKARDVKGSLLDHIEKSPSSLHVAYNIQKEVTKVGFDWDDVNGIWEKFGEEVKELKDAVHQKDDRAIEEELGDVFFILTNIAKWYRINPEIALRKTITKFTSRFRYVEEKVKQSGKDFSDFKLEQLDVFWDEKKKMER